VLKRWRVGSAVALLAVFVIVALTGANAAGVVTQSGPKLFAAGGGGGGGGNRLKGDEYLASVITSSGDGPNFGFDTRNITNPTNTVTRTYNATGGPANRPYVRLVVTDTLDINEWGNEWSDNNWYPGSPRWGQSIFVRFSVRLQGAHQRFGKIFVFNAGAPQDGDDRFIVTIEDWATGGSVINLQRGAHTYIRTTDGSYISATPGDPETGGWSYSETGQALPSLNVWYDVQIEIRFASAEGVMDGYLKCWVDNDTYASTPWVTTADIPLTYQTGDNAKFLTMFAYWQAIGSPFTVDMADIRIGPTFDSNWNASGT